MAIKKHNTWLLWRFDTYGLVIITYANFIIDKCENYSEKRNIKFDANKSIASNAGFKIYTIGNDDDIYLFINHNKLNVVEESKYLGLIINKNNDGNDITLSKYKTLERCFFSLNGFGMKSPGVSPGFNL